MAVLAKDSVTLASITDVDYMRRYYLLQLSTLSAPAVPTTNPPSGSWVTTEPTYTEGSTNSLYVTDLVVFSDGTFDYLPVQKSSSYEAAKVAYNKALTAQNAANQALETSGLAYEMATGDNLQPNPGFESGTVGWSGFSASASLDTTVKRSGGASLKIISSTGSAQIVEGAWIPSLPGIEEKFYIECWMRGTRSGSQTGETGLWNRALDANGVGIWPSSPITVQAQDLSATWTKYSGVLTIPANATQFLLRANIRADVASGVTVWFDDIVIRRIDKTAYDAALAAQNAANQAQTSADAANNNALSRGENLVTNGTGYLGNNTNFSWTTYDKSIAPEGVTGAFVTPVRAAGWGQFTTNEIIPIKLGATYKFDHLVRETVDGESARYLVFLQTLDAYGNAIYTSHYVHSANTTTTLAAALNPGDTTIKLTNSANWRGSASYPGNHRSIIFWGYTDPGGKVWAAHTYSRWSYNDMWADGGLNSATHTITLRTPWAGPAFPAGAQVSNGTSGGDTLTAQSGVNSTEGWKPFSFTWTAGAPPTVTAATGRQGASLTGGWVPPGTAAVKIGWYPKIVHAETTTNSRIAIAGVSFSEAAAAQATATTALTSANGRNSIITSTGNATGTTNPNTGLANVKGDQWTKVDSLTTNNAIASWYWDGSWKPQLIKNELIHSLDVVKLTASAARIQQAVINKIVADIGYFNAIVVDSATAQNIAASIANIVQARVENLTVTAGATINSAVIQKLAAELIVAQVLSTAVDPTSKLYALMDSAGFRVINDETGMDVVRLGPGVDNLLQVGDATIDYTGTVSGKVGYFDEVYVAGEKIERHSNSLPRGIVSWGQLYGGNSRQLQGRDQVIGLEASLAPGRVYRLATSRSHIIKTQNSSVRPLLKLHYTLDGTYPGAPPGWDSTAKAESMNSGWSNPDWRGVPGMEVFIDRRNQPLTEAPTLLRAGLTLGDEANAGWAQLAATVHRHIIYVEDLGTQFPDRGTPYFSGGEQAIKIRTMQRFVATGWANYIIGGSRDYDHSAPWQGRSVNHGVSQHECFFFFDSMTAALSGATIHRITLVARSGTWGADRGTGRWGWHNIYGSIPSSGQFLNHMVETTNWPRGTMQAINIIPGEFQYWQNGTRRGFGFGSSSSAPEHFGSFSPNLADFWIDVDYEK